MQGGGQYDAWILAASRRYNVDPRLVRAVLRQESDLGRDTRPSLPNDPDSPVGIAQLRPSTLRGLLGPNADPNDPETAINGAAAYLDQGMRVAETNGYNNPGAYAVAHYIGGPNTKEWGPATAQHVQAVAGKLREDDPTLAAPGPTATPSGATGNLNIGVSPQAAPTLVKVDPRLLDIVNQTSQFLQPGWRAEITSGYRSTDEKLGGASLHPYGGAVDIQLYGPDGKPVPNNQSPQNFRTYEMFAQVAKKLQNQLYPELDPGFAWGGYFHNGGMPNYGANDLMHLSINERPGAGSWEGGLNQLGKDAGFDRGGPPSQGMGNVADFQMPLTPGGASVPIARNVPAAPIQLASAGVSDVPSIPAGGAPRPVYRDGQLVIEPRYQPLSPADQADLETALRAQEGKGQAPAAPGRLPETWAQTGAPASVAAAPPSLYTASSPEEQARWNQASTPQGYGALTALAQGATGAGAARGAAAGPTPAQGAPGTGSLDIAMLNVPELGLGMPPATTARAAPIAAQPRNLSDELISGMQPEDVLGVVGRTDLTDADRMAIQRRLEALSGGQ